MQIGVLSDTHDSLPGRVIETFRDVDEIWHLGDVTNPAVLDALADKKLFVVRGNCDFCHDWPITLNLEREGVRFHLVHIPPEDIPPETHVVLHGHTHIPRDEVVRGIRWLNPGSPSRPKGGHRPSCAILSFQDGEMFWQSIDL